MRPGLSATIGALGILVGTGTVQADWLDDVWSEEWVQMNGNPAVSMSGDGVQIVVPAILLQQAYEEGFTTEQALQDFLDRHGQRCSHLVDLNLPHPNLKVTLSLQVPAALESIPENDEVLAAVKSTLLRYRTDDSIPLLFTISPVKFEYSINYVPTHQVHCVAPNDDDMTS
jgi:hypothetical protein